MRVRIGVSARIAGTTEFELDGQDAEDFERDPNRWAERSAEDAAQRVYEEGGDLDPDVDELDVYDEATGKWRSVPE